MDAFISLIKTDNLAIVLLLVAVAYLTKRLMDVEKKLEKAQETITNLSCKVGKLEGKELVEDKLSTILEQMGTKLDILASKKLKKA